MTNKCHVPAFLYFYKVWHVMKTWRKFFSLQLECDTVSGFLHSIRDCESKKKKKRRRTNDKCLSVMVCTVDFTLSTFKATPETIKLS